MRQVMRCPFFFFFQAEDGIRDLIVTGVQTCALPISLLVRAEAPGGNPAVEGAVTEHGPGVAVDAVAHKDPVGTGEDAHPIEGDIPAGQNLKGSAAEPEGEVTNDEIVAVAYGQSTRGFPGHAQAHVVGICHAGIIRDPRYMVLGRLQTDVESMVLGVVVNAGTHVDPRVMDSLPR